MITELEEATLPGPDRLLSVRSGKIKPLGNGGLLSGIDKQALQGLVEVGTVGISGDQIDYPFHGGPEKALHQYCAGHYPKWRHEKPDKKHLFKIGAFGENIAVGNMNEGNVCIGDVYSIGSEVVVQVTEPRLPCFKLNARFEWPQAARRVQKTNRYGWYLRIIQTGVIQEGDTMVLIKRLNPRWSIKNVVQVLFDKDIDASLVSELGVIDGLGKEIQRKALKRMEGNAENTLVRTKGAAFNWASYEVEDAQMIAPRVRKLTLIRKGPKDRLSAQNDMGAHAYVRLRFGPSQSLERSYSVVSGDFSRFVLAVSLDDNSRGGSRYLHKDLTVRDHIDVVRGENGELLRLPRDFDPSQIGRHIFIIGGIGVTAFLQKIETLNREKVSVEVHYACRSLEEAAFKEKLPKETTAYYAKDQNQRLNVDDVIPGPVNEGDLMTKIYTCGPESLMDAVKFRCDELGYPSHLLHSESFGAPAMGPLGDPFEVVVDDSDSDMKTDVKVGAEESLLDALENAGFEVPYSCKAGRCGICVVNVRCGQVDHKGTGLLEESKATSMLSCVSRGRGKIEIEIE